MDNTEYSFPTGLTCLLILPGCQTVKDLFLWTISCYLGWVWSSVQCQDSQLVQGITQGGPCTDDYHHQGYSVMFASKQTPCFAFSVPVMTVRALKLQVSASVTHQKSYSHSSQHLRIVCLSQVKFLSLIHTIILYSWNQVKQGPLISNGDLEWEKKSFSPKSLCFLFKMDRSQQWKNYNCAFFCETEKLHSSIFLSPDSSIIKGRDGGWILVSSED